MINRIPSEWAFQLFLQEASLNSNSNDSLNPSLASTPPIDIPKDSEEYQAFLKSQLELECAAAALSQVSPLPPSFNETDSTTLTLATTNENSTIVNSVFSIDASDDDNECENELEENSDAKRLKRMISNRESARRSRKRKQEQLTELEKQVAQLKTENTSLSKRLDDVSKKYSEASTTNRVLTADIETLRTKVKMAEEMMKTVTGVASSMGTAVLERVGNASKKRVGELERYACQ